MKKILSQIIVFVDKCGYSLIQHQILQFALVRESK